MVTLGYEAKLLVKGAVIHGGTQVVFCLRMSLDHLRRSCRGGRNSVASVHQAPQRFANRETFEAFDDPDHEKLFMSVRVRPTDRLGENWLGLEHANTEWRRQARRVLRVRRPTSTTSWCVGARAPGTLRLLRPMVRCS